MEPAQSVSTVEKPEKLLGEKVTEKIETVILEAAHNACKSACVEGKSMGEGKSLEEGSGEQDCGVLEAKVRLCHKSDSQKDWIELT